MGENKVLYRIMDGKAFRKRDKKIVNFRVRPDDYEEIKKRANERGLTITEYILSCCLVGRIFPMGDELSNLRVEVNRLGVNVNQIAKKANSGEIKAVGVDEFIKEQENLAALMEKILRKLERV